MKLLVGLHLTLIFLLENRKDGRKIIWGNRGKILHLDSIDVDFFREEGKKKKKAVLLGQPLTSISSSRKPKTG